MAASIDDLTNVADVNTWLNFTDTNATRDNLIQLLITSFSYHFLAQLNRANPFRSQNFVERRNGNDGTVMMTRQYPITAVNAVQVGTTVIPASPDYVQNGYVATDYAISLIGYTFDKGYGNVVLTYAAGYSAVPLDVAQACKEFVALKYKERARIGLQSEHLDRESVSYFGMRSGEEFPPSVQAMVEHYKRRVPVIT